MGQELKVRVAFFVIDKGTGHRVQVVGLPLLAMLAAEFAPIWQGQDANRWTSAKKALSLTAI